MNFNANPDHNLEPDKANNNSYNFTINNNYFSYQGIYIWVFYFQNEFGKKIRSILVDLLLNATKFL